MIYLTRKLNEVVCYLAVGLMLALVACGSDGNGGQSDEGVHSTLAYVVSECHEDTHFLTARQRLQVVHDYGDPVTVAEIPTFGRLPALGLCPLYGISRNGTLGAYGLGFQRMAVSPDGSGIVFEVNFDFSIFRRVGARNPLSTEQEGIFFVHADGTGLRRLGNPSREYAQRLGIIPSPAMPSGPVYINLFFSFSPDGKSVAFADRGPGPAGEDAAQIVIMDIETGARRAVSHLPPATSPDPSNPVAPTILWCFWQDDETIGFRSRANPNGLNPEEIYSDFIVKIDDTNLTLYPPFVPAALPDSHVVPQFTITQPVTDSFVTFLSMPGTPEYVPPDSFPPNPPIQELFLLARDQALQLTKFDRVDGQSAVLDASNQRVFFAASTNRLGTNPSENCQVFSVDTDGSNLQQLTRFVTAEHSVRGCFNTNVFQPGCGILGEPILDSEAQELVIDSDCNPLGTNPAGDQFFTVEMDGSSVRQITFTRGMVTAADGSVDVELPGPLAMRFF